MIANKCKAVILCACAVVFVYIYISLYVYLFCTWFSSFYQLLL